MTGSKFPAVWERHFLSRKKSTESIFLKKHWILALQFPRSLQSRVLFRIQILNLGFLKIFSTQSTCQVCTSFSLVAFPVKSPGSSTPIRGIESFSSAYLFPVCAYSVKGPCKISQLHLQLPFLSKSIRRHQQKAQSASAKNIVFLASGITWRDVFVVKIHAFPLALWRQKLINQTRVSLSSDSWPRASGCDRFGCVKRTHAPWGKDATGLLRQRAKIK